VAQLEPLGVAQLEPLGVAQFGARGRCLSAGWAVRRRTDASLS